MPYFVVIAVVYSLPASMSVVAYQLTSYYTTAAVLLLCSKVTLLNLFLGTQVYQYHRTLTGNILIPVLALRSEHQTNGDYVSDQKKSGTCLVLSVAYCTRRTSAQQHTGQ